MTDEQQLLKQGKCPSCFGFKKRKYQGEAADYDCFECNGTGKASEYLKHKRQQQQQQRQMIKRFKQSAPKPKYLTLKQAIAAEKEMRRLESDPTVSKRQLRLFLQSLMPCGHITTNLLTCPDPPYGCVVCIKAKSLNIKRSKT